MKNPDRWSSSFWLLFSIITCIESYRLGIGSFHNPGDGFLPFLTGIAFGIFSSILLIINLIKKENEDERVFEKIKWKNVILVLVSLFIYAIVLEILGFVLSTLILIIALLRIIERRNWYIVIIIAVASALVSYAVFQLWLQSQLPKGIFGI